MRPQTSPAAPASPRQPVWFVGLLILLALAPLPFGANRPWASDMLGLCAGCLLALCARDLGRDPALWPTGAPWRRLGFSALSFLAVILWGWLQTTVGIEPAHPLWHSAATALALPDAGSISLTPDRFGECALRIFSYAACFLIAFIGGLHSGRAKLLLQTLAFIAVAYAFYGLMMQSSGFDVILWFKKWAYQGFLTSTFVNKNSYATYAGLGLLCCLGLFRQHFAARPPLQFSIMTLEKISARDLYIVTMCLAIFGALILTSSRGGITSTCLGSLGFVIALAVNHRWTGKRWLMILVPSLVFLIGFAGFTNSLFLDRIDPQNLANDSMLRINAYETIFRALADNPWQGFGLGGFDSAFHLFRDADIHDWFEHAHDDYLELAVELGIPAALLYLAAIMAMIGCCAQGVARRRKHEIYCIIAVGASVLIGAHSLVDFSMQIPAIAATYAVILGLGVAQSWSSRKATEE